MKSTTQRVTRRADTIYDNDVGRWHMITTPSDNARWRRRPTVMPATMIELEDDNDDDY